MTLINIKKKLTGFTIDADISFDNEFVILTGPNGSGKTTILKMIAGLEKPDSGTITVDEQVLFDNATNLAPEKRRIGYVCQETTLFPWLTVEKNVSFGKNRESTGERDWLSELYSALDIGHILNRLPKNLSGGEKERVAIAMALLPKPKMLLLDEPIGRVDKELRPRIRGFLKDIRQRWKIPVIMVTHDLAEASVLGDKTFELDEGIISAKNEKNTVSRVAARDGIKMPAISY